MVKSVNKEKEIKVIIREETKMIKLGLPTDPEELPKEGGVFIPTEETIDISGFREGDSVFIMTSTNLVGKTELDDVSVHTGSSLKHMAKNKIIIILVILVLISVAVFCFFFVKEKKNKFEGESFTTGESAITQTFSLSGKVASIDVKNGFLTVKTANEEVKVIISDTTKLIKLEAPFSPDNPPPAGTQFVPEKKEINLSDFKEGDEVLVISQEDIGGKSEIDNVNLVQILP